MVIKILLEGWVSSLCMIFTFYRNFRRIILASILSEGLILNPGKVVNKFFGTKIYLLLELHFERYKMSMVDFNTKMSIGS